MSADFTHLHVHSQFSLLDSTIRLEGLLEAAHQDKMSAVALTDHGNMFGALDFYLKAKEFGIKPILGCEMYLAPQSRLMRGTHTSGDDELAPYSTARSGMSHLILLVQNEVGYLNLCKLVSSGFLEGFYYKPRIDKEILAAHTEGLIATSACLKGEVTNYCVLGDMDRAREAAKWYRDVFGGRFYLEMQQNGLPQQMMVNDRFQELSAELGIPLIATADCHYLKREHAPMQEVLMAIQTGRNLDEGTGSGMKSEEFYFKTQATIKEEFSHRPDAIANTMAIANSCQFDFQFEDTKGKKIYHFPKFDPPEGKTPEQYLRDLSHRGLQDRLSAQASQRESGPFTEEEQKPYLARLERELNVIIEMGFTGYFLIVADFIGYGKSHGIPVGPGRGSGAGSLVAYVLGITDLDPLEHGLIFERFLNPERVSLPDFDVDFCMDKRDKVIEYVSQKYGKDCVAQIITFGKLQARGVIRDVGRAFGMLAPDVDKIAKLVPETINITLDEAFAQEPRLRALTEQDRQLAHLFEVCRTLEGLPRHASIHAAGLVISNRPMVEHCALTRGKNDELVIQLDMNNADRIGLIKFDFLGLKTLTFLQRAEELIHRRHPHSSFSLTGIDITDKKMYEMLAKGDTLGVFQLESSGMQDLMKKVKPDCFADIVASNALYRPGPLESGMVDDFIARKHGQTPVQYDFEELRPILHETYGVIVYQEQVQQVAMRLANYTAGSADLLRRAMGKKKPEEMAKQKERFVQGALANRFDPGKVDHLFELMAKFAGYGFNKSHAAAYSLVTCQTAYIKAHFPVEFYAALLSIERENTDKITKYIADASRHGISVLPPHINESETDFTVLSEAQIRFGLGAIKGVGQVAIDSVLETRKKLGPFKDLYDLCARTNNRTVNKRVIEAFTKAGALDGFKIHRASLFKAIDPALEAGASIQKQNDQNQPSFLDLLGEADESFSHRTVTYPDAEPWERLLELKYEKDTIGFFVSGHPLDDFQTELQRYTTTTIADCVHAGRSKEVLLGATVAGLREFITRKGDRMAFVTLSDRNDEIDAVVFGDVYAECEELLKSDEPIWIKGQLERSENSSKILLSKKGNGKVFPLRYAYELLGREVHIHLNPLKKTGPDTLARFKSLLESTQNIQGAVPVYLHIKTQERADAILKLKGGIPLKREMVHSIRSLFPADGVNIEFR
jgi:DNA polymerase III subunit alpha